MTNTLKVAPSGEREIAFTRVFDAPRQLVFGAWTQPDPLKRWLYGPEQWPVAVCDIDLTIGGEARFVWRHRDGKDVGMSGVYRVRDRLGAGADPFLAGATFTLAISASAPRPESGAAELIAYQERMAARPAFQRAHQAQRPPQQTSIRR